jgi:3-isopropylmalate dehydrogenase
MEGVSKTIVVLPGDGIGPEVTDAAVAVLQTCGREFGHRFEWVDMPIGGAALERTGHPLPPATLDACLHADAVLLGAVGGPQWDHRPPGRRPETGLLELRRALGLYVNLRPVRLRESLARLSPLRASVRFNFEIIRELGGGIYFGPRGQQGQNGEEAAFDTELYSVGEIQRVAHFAFERAWRRRRTVHSVDKANVLASSALWRRTVSEIGRLHPGVSLHHLYVDTAAMELIRAPEQFDVVLTSNLFGDILSDEAAALVGSIGLLPSASFGHGPALYEPVHGSAPALAGRDCACPVGAILSGALMLAESFGLREEAHAVESAVEAVLAAGLRTPDLAEPESTRVGTRDFAAAVCEQLMRQAAHLAHRGYGWGV